MRYEYWIISLSLLEADCTFFTENDFATYNADKNLSEFYSYQFCKFFLMSFCF